MKKTFRLVLLAVGLFVAGTSAIAQNDNSAGNAEGLSKGYWVIQENKNNPAGQTVFFYNADNKLVSKQQFKGKKLNPESRKTRVKLKKSLKEALNKTYYSMGEADQPLYFAGLN